MVRYQESEPGLRAVRRAAKEEHAKGWHAASDDELHGKLAEHHGEQDALTDADHGNISRAIAVLKRHHGSGDGLMKRLREKAAEYAFTLQDAQASPLDREKARRRLFGMVEMLRRVKAPEETPIAGQRKAMEKALAIHLGDKVAADIAGQLGLNVAQHTVSWHVKRALQAEIPQPSPDVVETDDQKRDRERAERVETDKKTRLITADVTERVGAFLKRFGVPIPTTASKSVAEVQAEIEGGSASHDWQKADRERRNKEYKEAKDFAEKNWRKPPEPEAVKASTWIAVRTKQQLEELGKDRAKLTNLERMQREYRNTYKGDWSPEATAIREAYTKEIDRPSVRKLLKKYRESWMGVALPEPSTALDTVNDNIHRLESAWKGPDGPDFSQYSHFGAKAHAEHLAALKAAVAKESPIPAEVVSDYLWETWIPQKYRDNDTIYGMKRDHAAYVQGHLPYMAAHLDHALSSPEARKVRQSMEVAKQAADESLKQAQSERDAVSERWRAKYAVERSLSALVAPWKNNDGSLRDDMPEDKQAEYHRMKNEVDEKTSEWHRRDKEADEKVKEIGHKWLEQFLPKQAASPEIPSAEHLTDQSKANLVKANEFLRKIVGAAWGTVKPELKAMDVGGRANAGGGAINTPPDVSISTFVHEFGHILEEQNGSVLGALSRAFAMKQVAAHAEHPEHLGAGHDPHEIGAQDGFLDSYTGKFYVYDVSEVLSMGMQWLYDDPIKLFQKSPDHFAYTIAALHGYLTR